MSFLSFVRAIFCHESWESRLYTPTMIQKIDDTYFISDCWHNRIIYSKKISASIKRWKTLSDDVFGGHTLAYSGKFVLGQYGQRFDFCLGEE